MSKSKRYGHSLIVFFSKFDNKQVVGFHGDLMAFSQNGHFSMVRGRRRHVSFLL